MPREPETVAAVGLLFRTQWHQVNGRPDAFCNFMVVPTFLSWTPKTTAKISKRWEKMVGVTLLDHQIVQKDANPSLTLFNAMKGSRLPLSNFICNNLSIAPI